jgi:hypothetical protein
VKSPLHLGPIYIDQVAASYLQANGLQYDQVTGQIVTGENRLAILRTAVVLDERIKGFDLNLQYSPQLAFSNGQFQTDLSNQNVGLSSTFLLSPRWTLVLRETYSERNGQTLFGDFNLDVNAVSGQTADSPFLQNFHKEINTDGFFSLTYQMSERDSISITPDGHTYDAYLTPTATSATLSYAYGGQVGWGHIITERSTLNAYGGWDRRFTEYGQPISDYYSFGMGYTNRITQTVTIHGDIGGSTVANTGGRYWTSIGNASIRKDFRSSNISLSYYRGNGFGTFNQTGYADRVDVSYDIRILQRLSLGAGGSRETGSSLGGGNTQYTGEYATGRAGFYLGAGLGISANIGRRWQSGAGVGPDAGDTTFFAGSLTWQPSRTRSPYGTY